MRSHYKNFSRSNIKEFEKNASFYLNHLQRKSKKYQNCKGFNQKRDFPKLKRRIDFFWIKSRILCKVVVQIRFLVFFKKGQQIILNSKKILIM